MAITITVEDGTGLAGANSYVSQVEVDTYAEAHLYASAWTAATTGNKDKAIAMATRLLDSHTQWTTGDKKSATQALQWPRESAYLDGFEIATNVVPQEVKNTTAELAILLISTDLTKDVDQNKIDNIGLGKGALNIAFKDNPKKRQIPFHVTRLLRGLGRIAGEGSGVNVVNAFR